MDEHFKEEQRLTQIWLWVIILGIASVQWYILIVQVFFKIPVGNNPASDMLAVIIWVLAGIILPVFMYFCKLSISVEKYGIKFRYFLLQIKYKEIKFEDILDYESIKYKPLREYGGWGIRMGKNGIAYTVKGNKGVLLKLKNGKQILLGSQRAEEFKKTLDIFMKEDQ